jgi:gas vesicle protein
MKQTTVCVASLLGGLIIGSALAMLLTPQSGPELRNNIRDLFDREVDKMRQEFDKVRCHCNEKPVE